MAGRRKGTEKTGGRKKGTPNKISGTVKEWISSIIDKNRNKFEEDLELLEPGERVRVISSLLNYVAPKQAPSSPGEELRKEREMLYDLLMDLPDEFVHRVSDRLNKLEKSDNYGN